MNRLRASRARAPLPISGNIPKPQIIDNRTLRCQTTALEAAGWRVLRFCECEVREDPTRVAEDIRLTMIPVAAERSHRWVVERVEVLDPTTDLERHFLVDLRDPTAKINQDRVQSPPRKGKK